MQPFSFRCPNCDALLRVRDPALVGRNVPCPDCGQPFQIAYDGRHVAKLDIEPPEPPLVQEEMVAVSEPEEQLRTPAAPHNDVPWWMEPHVIAWGVAIVFAAAMAIVLWRHEPPRKKLAARPANDDAVADQNASAPLPDADPPAAPEADADEHDLWNAPVDDSPGQLSRLGELIARQRELEGHFPAGTVGKGEPDERFSWLAKIAAQQDDAEIVPNWDQGWRDPVNQRFVRRRMPVFLNPELEQLTGQAGYPAGHFVGVAGVGSDAAELALPHERAGIFGVSRRTTVKDVQDGLAQTMMVAGVQSRLGSWAAGGPATVRAFVDEPYINGPDGFGTGQADGMWVLMGDGRVVFRSNETAAEVIRGEAAMADAYLRNPPAMPPTAEVAESDPEQAVEAGEADPSKPLENSLDELTKIVDEIADVEQQKADAAPPPPKLTEKEIQLRLEQPLARYQSPPGATFGPVFEELAEMAAVPVEYDEEAWKRDGGPWSRPVEFDFADVTVGDVLRQVLASVGLAAKIGDGKVTIEETEKS